MSATRHENGVVQFFINTLIVLGPALLLWSMARQPLSLPVVLAAGQVVDWLFPAWATGVEMEGTHAVLITSITVMHDTGRQALLTPSAEVLNYSYGLPLLVALFFASRAQGWWWKLLLGACLLVPFQVFGVVFAWLVAVAVHAQAATQAVTGFGPLHQNLFGIAYQLGTLILPTLSPVIIWLLAQEQFARQLVFKGLGTKGQEPSDAA